ncbi:hypothetical protein CAL14_10165 [Bordetella genomosp. 9]|uniref:HPP family protein n=1 Tax=Bordetella genomosp. 9 TaxID=1416803 RepID=UPI000A2961E0|nr:HPP family protein [Bordetella genomosp. 9]ARP90616.1 hypothetical protein CAL14_10165 [Bordetella genomosp. 9]
MVSTALKNWLARFAPVPVGANARERIYGSLGALLGLLCTEWVGRHALGVSSPWFIAPMGASSVLLFAAPASPLAQPWSLLAGNVSAALVGVFFAQVIPDAGLAAACAVAAAIAVMFALRCLHPPSGAVALTAVLGGAPVAKLGFAFALYPVALNSAVLLCIAVVFNGVLKRNYPHRPAERPAHGRAPVAATATPLGFTAADLDAALQTHEQLLDISRDDLTDIVMEAERRASLRRFGDLLCRDVMSLDVPIMREDDSLEEAARQFDRYRVVALPVADAEGRMLGTVAQADVLARAHAPKLAALHGEPAPAPTVRDCMRTEVPFATLVTPAIELVPPMARRITCVPVVDDAGKIAGVVTAAEMVQALYQLTLAAPTLAEGRGRGVARSDDQSGSAAPQSSRSLRGNAA